MALPRSSTNAGYVRPQQTGGTAGRTATQHDQGRGVTPSQNGGTAGHGAATVDSKKHAVPMKA